MPHAFWILLLAKMTTTAIIVVAASKVVERAGPFLGAMVAPMVAVVGSILLNLVQYRRERDALLAGRALLSPRLPPPAAPSP